MGSMQKMKLSYLDQSNRVLFVTKTRQDNDVTGCIGLVYTETQFEISRPI